MEEVFLTNDFYVPSLNGRLFCSRRDPIREAVQWYQLNKEKIENADRITIIGLGAGFHLHLIPRDKLVCYVELEPDLIDRFRRLYPDSQAFPLQSIEFLENSEVLSFRPAQIGNEEIYRPLEDKSQLNIKLIGALIEKMKIQNIESTQWLVLRELVR